MSRTSDNRKRSLGHGDHTPNLTPALLMLVALLLSSPTGSTAFSGSSLGASRTPTSSSRLGFRNGDEVDTKFRPKLGSSRTDEPAAANNWWGGLMPAAPKSEEDEASQRVDEYLKFLDKRYQQIHETDQQPAQSQELAPPTFSVMRWLQKEPAQSSKSDALFALGVAAERVEALNQSETAEAPMKTAEGERVLKKSALETSIKNLKESPLFKRAVGSRKALLRYESIKVRQLFAVAASTLKKVPMATTRLFKAGGGPKSMAVVFGVLSVLLVHVLLPTIGAVLKESLATQA